MHRTLNFKFYNEKVIHYQNLMIKSYYYYYYIYQLLFQSKKSQAEISSVASTSTSVRPSASRREWKHHLPSLQHVEAPLVPHRIEIQPTLRPLLPPIQSSRPLQTLSTQRGRPSRATEPIRGTPKTVMYECIQSNTSMPTVSSAPTVELQTRSHPVRQTHLSHFVLDNRPKTSPEKLYVVGHSLAQEIHKETKEMCRILGEVRRRHWSQELANRTEIPRRVSPPLSVAPTPAQPEQSQSQPSKKPRRWRCSQCRRKLNITNAHTCRCGKHFCASHRYAETHNCTYDYKADGKKFLAQTNPLVIATKLPKI